MKRMIVTMLACLMMVGGTSVTAFAASNETETQTETTVSGNQVDQKAQTNVDDTTKESGDEKMTEAEVQEQINVTESDDGTVTFSFGDWQWSMDDAKETTKEGTVTDVGSYLHLRNGAGMNYDIIGHLLPGAKVKVVGEDGDWYQVIVPEQTGYVHSDYLKVLEKIGTKDVDEEMLGKLLYMMMLSTNGSNVSLTPDGNLTLVDDIGSTTGAGQQFLTFVTKSGNTFYMIIDRNDKGEENVHFLNLVDEADLLALMDEDAANQIKKPETTVEPVEEKPTETVEQEPEKEIKPEKKKSPVMALILLFLIGAGGVGGFLYFKMNDKKKVTTDAPDPDADYSDEEDDSYDLPDDEEDEESDEYDEETEDYSDEEEE